MIRHRRSERGSFLLATLLFTVVLAGLSVAALSNGLADRTAIRHRETASKALEIAEAGIIYAEMEIFALADMGTDGIGNGIGVVGAGDFEVSATRNGTLPDRWEIVARGAFGQSVRRIAVGVRRRSGNWFNDGFFARETLNFSGGISTDSWHSTNDGPYAELTFNTDGGGSYFNTEGHVGSNLGIDIGGTAAHIRGNAIPGMGHTTEMSGQPHVGDTVPRRAIIELLPPPEEDFQLAHDAVALDPTAGIEIWNDVNEDGIVDPDTEFVTDPNWRQVGYNTSTYSLAPKGQTNIVLTGGTYFFTEIDLGGGATLTTTGPCTIYVTGDLDLTGGGLVNMTGVAADCQIFAHPYQIPESFNPAGAEIKISGGDQVVMAIYAPYRDVTIGGTGDLWGSLVGQNIDVLGDAYFHYDEALGDVPGDNPVYLERLYWNELGTLRR